MTSDALRGGAVLLTVLAGVTAAAAAEPGQDVGKRIHQRHLERAAEDVAAAKSVMRQSLFADEPTAPARQPGLVALTVAAAALLASLVALGVAFAR